MGLQTWYWLTVGCGGRDKESNSGVEGNIWLRIMSGDPGGFRAELCNSGVTVKMWP